MARATQLDILVRAMVGALLVLSPVAVGSQQPAGEKLVAPPVVITVTLGQPVLAATPARPLLSGREVIIRVNGEPADRPLWQLGYGKNVLAQGRLKLDDAGQGHFRILLPGVRHRAACELVVRAAQTKASRPVVIFPPAMLALAARRIKQHRLGVVDQGRRVHRALQAEGVVFEDLNPQMARDLFDGGTVILAGFSRRETLIDTCRRMTGRLEKGMSVVVVNPPRKWSAWGVGRVELAKPVSAPANVAKELGQIVLDVDLGRGPWRSALKAKAQATVLAKLRLRADPGWQTSQAAGSARVARKGLEGNRPPHFPLVLARRVGAGRVVVALLPQLNKPFTDAVGRGMLDALILWTLKAKDPPPDKARET